MTTHSFIKNKKSQFLLLAAIAILGITSLSNCTETTQAAVTPPPAPAVPIIEVKQAPVVTSKEFTATVEGSKDIEIRPQVKGILSQILVDEGSHVEKGQLLFKIDERPYLQAYNQATAKLSASEAALKLAKINVNRLEPLVARNVVSDVELQTAEASYEQAKAAVAQARAEQASASINLDYTKITAPVSGYIGSLPYKTGSLVSDGDPLALTVLSETDKMHVYFSMSEKDFSQFKTNFEGNSMEEKLAKVPPVELILADGSIYEQKGKVELVEGAFNKDAGAISFRASFPNEHGLLRSGNTGKIRLFDQAIEGVVIPQGATFEIQDKVFAFQVADSNKVKSVPIQVAVKKGNYYVLDKGLEAGDKIVLQGLDRIKNGVQVNPQMVSIDSIFKANPY